MQIRKMIEQDRPAVLDLMRVFYSSDAVWTNGSNEIFNKDIDMCVGDSQYAEGYVFTKEEKIIGYGMIAKSYSTEFGKPCIWIEDIFILSDYRGNGLGSRFIREVRNQFPDAILRLELEKDNKQALGTYRKNGFAELPYAEMVLL